MTRHLRSDLANLEKLLLRLGSQVEQAMKEVMAALVERNPDLARQVIQRDREIDIREVELEEECLKVLALHQPVATDLRFVAACIKIDNDLERIGDLVCNIAERSISLSDMAPVRLSQKLRQMMELGMDMLRDSLSAFVREDPSLARAVCKRDDTVDELNREVIRELLSEMYGDPTFIAQAVELISVSKALERVADHTTNIAEDVVYLVEGQIIRHK